ncbi:MAG: hypothetical protein N2749_04775 [Clostridia bacterium]|nr:hypothetical protein [Clostridia bacterium]
MSKTDKKTSSKENHNLIQISVIYAENGETYEELMIKIINQLLGR